MKWARSLITQLIICLMIRNKYLTGIADNPQITKKELCKQLGIKLVTIKNIRKYYKLDSPYTFWRRTKWGSERSVGESKISNRYANHSRVSLKSDAKSVINWKSIELWLFSYTYNGKNLDFKNRIEIKIWLL
jgi:hypothetical protein